MVIIPDRATKKIVQTNRSKLLGNMLASFALSFQENVGALRLAPRLKLITKTGDASATNLGVPVAFKFFDGHHFCIGGTRIFKNGSQDMSSAFTEDASAGVVTTYDPDYSDLEVFNDTLCGASSANLYSKTGSGGAGTGAWTDRTSTLSLGSGQAHVLRYFKKTDRLYVTDSRKIKSIDTSWVVATSGDYFLDLGQLIANFTISCMEMSSSRVWIGLIRMISSSGAITSSGTFQASVLEWDGISGQIIKEYPIDGASGIMAITIKNDVPEIIDSNGIFRRFNGSGFKEIGRLPLDPRALLGFPNNDASTARFMHFNGLKVDENGCLLANICNKSNLEEYLPSGIWEWSENNGVTHKFPFTYRAPSASAVTDYGQYHIAKPGALSVIKVPTTAGLVNTLFAGCEYYTDATAVKDGIFTDSAYPSDNTTYPEGQKSGYFVSPWALSSQLKDNWQKLWAKHSQFLTETDRIIFKHRSRKATAVEFSLTWVTTTTFTTTTDLRGKEGYEIEFLQGTGSGKCVHLVACTGSDGAGTYTFSVDDTVTGASGTAKARYQNWTKSFVIQDQNFEEAIQAIKDVNSMRFQFKVYCEWTGDNEIFEMGVVNVPSTNLK